MLRSFYPVLLAVPFSFSVACSSLPKDAPAELREARDAIRTAEKRDVDRTFPKTIKRAESDYDNAVRRFRESKSGQGVAEQKRDEAIQKARSATQLATEATALNDRIRGWDSDFNSYLAEQDRVRELERQAALPRETRVEVVETPRAGGAGNFRLRGSVAFFDTSKSTLRARDMRDVRGISQALRENEHMRVRIMGYADPRGNAAFNKKLSQKRAQAVANRLVQAGIPRDRIDVVGYGEVKDRRHLHRADLLQLDRRVDAMVISDETAVGH